MIDYSSGIEAFTEKHLQIRQRNFLERYVIKDLDSIYVWLVGQAMMLKTQIIIFFKSKVFAKKKQKPGQQIYFT